MDSPKSKMASYADLLKFSLFETIYARPLRHRRCPSNSDPDKPDPCAGGQGDKSHGTDPGDDGGHPKRPAKGRCKNTDLGAAGAGVTGGAVAKKPCRMTLPGGATFPGLLRHICHNSHCIQPLCFEGLILNLRQTIASNWTIEHTMAFSQICPAGYRLLGAYSGDEKDLGMPYALLEVSPSGYVTLEGRAAPTRATRAAVMGQIAQGEVANWECTFDAYFAHSSASLLTVNREMMALHYFHAITDSFALGAEAVAWGAKSSAAGALQWRSAAAAAASAAGAAAPGGDYASLFLGTRGLDLCYAHLLRPHITVAVKLEVGFTNPRCLATVAHEYRGGKFTTRGSFDTDGLVGGTVERRLGEGPNAVLSTALSALYNLTNDKFGLGFRCTASLL